MGDNRPEGRYKYARIERERRYLLRVLPKDLNVLVYRDIVDSYVLDTRLRLREVTLSTGEQIWKLTQKYPNTLSTFAQTVITNLYLSATEFAVLSVLPARRLFKRRFTYEFDQRRYAIDVFRGRLEGLILAETECETDEELAVLPLPSFAIREVTGDSRFTGGALSKSAVSDIASLE